MGMESKLIIFISSNFKKRILLFIDFLLCDFHQVSRR